MQYNRRFFLKTAALVSVMGTFASAENLLAQSEQTSNLFLERILAKSLKKGDTLGLTAPGGYITQEELSDAVATLEELGFKTYHTDAVLYRYGYFAGTDRQRADDLMHMFTNPDVDAILCVRGGYGSNRILDLLDFEIIKQNPKALIGYSDITSLINAFYKKIGLVAFHGPVAISSFNDFTVKSFEKVLMKGKKQFKYSNKRQENTENDTEFDQYTITQGAAEGILAGGNLVMLETLIGTEYEPDFENKIVFLEEVHEKPYRIDRMITHLLMATNLSKAAGIVLGIFKSCDIDNDESEESFTLKQVLIDRFAGLNIPCFYGMPFGHVRNKITLPVGIRAKMDANKKSLMLIEAAVLKERKKLKDFGY
ncbi:MAG: LD-carboxypeptidase [Bacteroidales bacterium]|nr:LD-carboxypeptidase [Bacteroidales bacterium]